MKAEKPENELIMKGMSDANEEKINRIETN
jgi:hypothetical protein